MKTIFRSIRAFAAVCAAGCALAASAAARPLARLADPAAWRTQTDKIAVASTAGRLDFAFTAVRGDGPVRVTLAEPMELAPGENLVFDCCLSRICPMMVLVTAEDAEGRSLRFKTRSLATLPNGIGGWGCNFLGGCFRGGLDELGTVRVDVPGFADPVRESYDPRGPVKPPFRMTGFEFLLEEETHAGPVNVWFSRFRAAKTSFKTDSFHAVFKDGQYFGEADGAPDLQLTDFGRIWGDRHRLEWSLRSRYDGEPFTNGVVQLDFASDDPRPFKLRFDRWLALPVLAEGTYWLKARLESGFSGGAYSVSRELDLRYDVFRSPVRPRGGEASGISAYPPIRMPEAGPFVVPEGVPSAEEILDPSREPLRIFCPMVREDAPDPVACYVKLFDEMVKEGKARTVEIQNRWAVCEPMPGKYDFAATLRILDEAAKRGIRCFVTFAPLVPPEWMPSIFTQNAEGNRFGHNMYLFHGGRFNLFFSPYARRAALAYLRNLVLATRNHPATLGYFYITEHSCEAPWCDWYEGFDPDTLAVFRKAMARRHGTVEAANRAWGTAFRSFEDVRPPAVFEDSSMAFRRDWLVFRRETVHEFVVKCLAAARELDPHRILMVYGDGLLMHRLDEVAKLRCISANGGCAVPQRLYSYAAWTAAGVPMRTEEISCSQWNSFPYQLDRSFFTILGGGGAASHVKMFTPQDADFESLRGGTRALDRWERFLPLWEEVRAAKAVDSRVCAWVSREGPYVNLKTVNFSGPALEGWDSLALMDAQIMAGLNISEDWKRASFLYLTPGACSSVVNAREERELVEYVKAGGHLFMPAEAGRRVIEREGEDWCLLRAFGFAPPAGPLRHNVHLGADLPLEGRDFGAGRVTVMWGDQLVPPGNDADTWRTPHFLRDLAAAAGAVLPIESDDRRVAAYLLEKGGRTFYLLACGRDGQAFSSGAIRVTLPDGTYRCEQLLGDSPFADGPRAASALATEGVPAEFRANEVRMWRFTAEGKDVLR